MRILKRFRMRGITRPPGAIWLRDQMREEAGIRKQQACALCAGLPPSTRE
jgi:hypothetical protein